MTVDLETIYAANEYPAEVDGIAFALRPGEPCLALDALLERRGVDSAAYITAWNPRGAPATLELNHAHQAELRQAVQDRFEVFEAPGGWPPGEVDALGEREPSLLVLGIARAEALELARRFVQAGIVVHERGRATELVMLMSGAAG